MGVRISHLQNDRKKAARMGPPIKNTIQIKNGDMNTKALMASFRSADVIFRISLDLLDYFV
jgi:hypothetical protein